MGELLKTLTTDDTDNHVLEIVYVKIGNPVFCLALYLTGVHFPGELSRFITWVGKKSSVDQSELKK